MSRQDDQASCPAANVLAPPPRAVPALAPLYLVLITTQIGWLLLLLTGWVFWNYCAFGADVKAAFFRAPLRTVTGTVTQVAPTRLREGIGHTESRSSSHVPTRPIYAVRYTFPLPAGAAGSGISYIGWDETGPDIGAPNRSGRGSEETMRPGVPVAVECVRFHPATSRIRGMRSNVYPAFVLISLAFPAGSFFFMWPGLHSYGRIRALLGAGMEDEKHANLEDPAGRMLKLPIDGPAAGWLGIRDGQLHAPSALGFGLTLLVPVLALVGNAVFIRNHLADIAYTWHTLMGEHNPRMSRPPETQNDGSPPGDKVSKRARSHDPLLAPPPRRVPPALPLYLVLLATQFGWLFLGAGMFAFWFNCAFGADLKAALFLAPTRTAVGTVTGSERTPLVEGTGTSYVAGDPRYSVGTQPIFAVHYAYPLPGGGTGRGTSYEGDSAEAGPMTETAGGSPPAGARSLPGELITVREGVVVGQRVPVQCVRAFPTASRIRGMRSNVFPPYALGVLVFALIGASLLRPAPRNLRRVRFLLASGVEDAKRRTLEDPDGRLLSLSLEDPAPRLMCIRAGQFHAPGPLAWAKVLLLPVGGLLISALYLCYHWAAVAYTWGGLMGR